MNHLVKRQFARLKQLESRFAKPFTQKGFRLHFQIVRKRHLALHLPVGRVACFLPKLFHCYIPQLPAVLVRQLAVFLLGIGIRIILLLCQQVKVFHFGRTRSSIADVDVGDKNASAISYPTAMSVLVDKKRMGVPSMPKSGNSPTSGNVR